MPATPTLVLAAAFTLTLAACESVLILPANEDIRSETLRVLTVADIHQIERLATAVTPTRPVRSIHATSRDQATVECGDPYFQDAKMVSFTARRRNGRWVADRSSIRTYQPIIVE
jgi:hypothetical protein